MTTKLSDLIEPSVFQSYVALQTTERSALFQSGIIQDDPEIRELARGEGKTFNMPFFNDLGSEESNVGSDDPDSRSVAKKITAGQDISVKHMRNQSWSSADILKSIVGNDPMAVIGGRVATYWVRDYQNTLIASLTGLFADNEANDSSDMVHNIATDDALPISADEKVSGEAVLLTQQTMGDAGASLAAIGMHSVIYTELKRQNLIEFIPNARGEVVFPRYLGLTVIVDDKCPAIMGTNRITYTTYLFGAGAVGYGEGESRIPVEVDRDGSGGDGAGIETLHSRREFILHPRGVKFTNNSVSGISPSNTELKDLLNWDRVYDRKLIRIAALKTNG